MIDMRPYQGRKVTLKCKNGSSVIGTINSTFSDGWIIKLDSLITYPCLTSSLFTGGMEVIEVVKHKEIDLSQWKPGMGLVFRSGSVLFPSSIEDKSTSNKGWWSIEGTSYTKEGIYIDIETPSDYDITDMITKEEFDTLYSFRYGQ